MASHQPNFSERQGITPIKPSQLGAMDADLKKSIWNVLYRYVFRSLSSKRLIDGGVHRTHEINTLHEFATVLWAGHFKERVDTVPFVPKDIENKIWDYYDKMSWNEVYDFVEFVYDCFVKEEYFLPHGGKVLPFCQVLTTEFDSVLRKENAGYSFIDGKISPLTNATEIAEVTEAVTSSTFVTAGDHMRKALRAFSDRKNPDYPIAVHQSITAVESAVDEVLETSGMKVSKGKFKIRLQEVANNYGLHEAFQTGISAIFGYTSDAGGRHGKAQNQDKTAGEARFFLVFCSAFINYLKTLSKK